MTDDLTWMSAHALLARIRARETSPVEVMTAVLARVDALEPILRAFITVEAERALAEARRATDAVVAGADLGPLHGIPVAVKDDAWAAGMRCTAGSLLFGRFSPTADGTVVERLRHAGAIIVGKTNMPEFAAWPRTRSRLAGECVNPWDTDRIPGASSGGSAAAVAAGVVPIAIGSDGGGSIRIPSAQCGVSGLFPTPGRVPAYGSFRYSLDASLGPIARDFADVALVQHVIAGPDPRDLTAMTARAPDVLGDLDAGAAGLRIGWSTDFGRISVDDATAAAASAAVRALERAGARIEEISARIEHPWGDGAFIAAAQVAAAEVAAEPDGDAAPSGLPDTSEAEPWLLRASSAGQMLQALPEFRTLREVYRDLLTPPSRLAERHPPSATASTANPHDLKRVMHRLFEMYDVICSPTMAHPAPLVPDHWGTPYSNTFMGTDFTFIANSTGCPATSVPCGLVRGLPVGLQVIGRPGDEATVLRVSRAVEAALTLLPRPGIGARR